MGFNGYLFASRWILQAPREAVWDAIVASELWPSWWPFLESVEEIAEGDRSGVGSMRRYNWGGTLPYSLSILITVTRIEPPELIEGRASGDIEGIGRWLITPAGDDSTMVRYTLEARAAKKWMRLMAPLLGRYFAWNHDRVMKAGGKGLAGHLGVRLLD